MQGVRRSHWFAWGGYGEHHCEKYTEHLLYTYYGRDTSLREIINQLVDDAFNDPWCECLPDDISQDDVRAALLNTMLNDAGRADYHNGSIAECSAKWMEANDEYDIEYGTDGNDDSESPIFVVLLTYHKD